MAMKMQVCLGFRDLGLRVQGCKWATFSVVECSLASCSLGVSFARLQMESPLAFW